MKINHQIYTAIAFVTFLISCKTSTEVLEDFSDIKRNTEAPLVLILENDLEYAEPEQQFDQLLLTLNYAKLGSEKATVSKFNGSGKVVPSTKVICIKETKTLTDRAVDSLHAFVARGGTLFLTKANFDDRFAFLMGLTPTYTMNVDQNAEGISTKDGAFLGKQLVTRLNEKHFGLDQSNFSNNITLLAGAINDPEYPAAVLNKVGKGKVVLYNSNTAFSEKTRGFAFSLLLLGLEGIPYPVANVASVHLHGDLFSNAASRNSNFTNASSSNTYDFVSDIWWPDMKGLATKHEIKYTISPFIPTDASGRLTKGWWGFDALKNGHELGFLAELNQTKVGFNASDHKKLEKYFEKSAKFLDDEDFEMVPSIYFSSDNAINGIPLEPLKQWLPNIKFIHGNFYGTKTANGIKEYEPSQVDPYYFNVPVISTGYTLDSSSKWDINTQFLFSGIWNHALSANAIGETKLQDDQGLGSWKTNGQGVGFFESFDSEIEKFKDTYPMLRFMKGSDASNTIVKWRYAYYRHSNQDGLYVVSSDDYSTDNNFEDFWHCYVSSTYDELFQGELEGVVMNYHKAKFFDGYLYQIKTDGAFMSLSDIGNENSGDVDQMNELVFNERAKFSDAKFSHLPFYKQLEFFRNRGQYAKATDLIENHLVNGNDLPMTQWMEYARMMQMQKKEEQLWSTYEQQYVLDPSKDMVYVGLKTRDLLGWPNKQIAENWLGKAIEWNLEGLSILREYSEEHYNEENRVRLKSVLRKITDITGEDVDRVKYVQFLVDFDDPQAMEELEQLQVCDSTYESIASKIATYYADNFAFDKAYQWSYCAEDIDSETVDGWMKNAQGFENMKAERPTVYYGILINNEKERAYREISRIAVCFDELKPLAGKIAQLYGEFQDYKGALSWAKCAENIDVRKLLIWNDEMNNNVAAKKLYWDYMAEHKDAHDVSELMADISLKIGDLTEACKIIATLPPGDSLNKLKWELNDNLKYASLQDRKGLIADYPNLFFEDTKNAVREESRVELGNDIFFRSNSIGNQSDFTQLTFLGGYALKDGRENIHEIAVVRGFVYEIEDIQNQTDNLERNLLGLDYSFIKLLKSDSRLTLGARLEGDNDNNTFFHLNAQLQKNNERGTLSAQLQYRPVPTGPGYVRDIYQASFKGIAAIKTNFGLNPSIQLRGRYFSDDNNDAMVTSKLEYELIGNDSWHFAPFVEGSYSVASEDNRNGFPYWIADDRLVGGGGAALRIGNAMGPLFIDASASYFVENQDQPSFERYFAALNFRIKKYFQLHAGVDYYTIDNFFSNGFSFGLRYDLRSYK